MRIAFFGGEPLAVPVLEELKTAGIIPDLIVCNPDAVVGRKKILTPPPTKVWAINNSISLWQPNSLKDQDQTTELTKSDWDLFVVVAYNKILPQNILDIPKLGTLNVHPSLLPKLRGPSPIRSAILQDQRETGVSIILLDEKMDHGPILAQTTVDISEKNWPTDGRELDKIMGQTGGVLLAKTLPRFVAGEITPTPQNHDEATFCFKITKEQAELDLDPFNLPSGEHAYQMLLKIRAFAGWPETFFVHNNKRFKIKEATLDNTGHLKITRIIPEGKGETDFSNYFSK